MEGMRVWKEELGEDMEGEEGGWGELKRRRENRVLRGWW
jgi:hypothetical protein